MRCRITCLAAALLSLLETIKERHMRCTRSGFISAPHWETEILNYLEHTRAGLPCVNYKLKPEVLKYTRVYLPLMP